MGLVHPGLSPFAIDFKLGLSNPYIASLLPERADARNAWELLTLKAVSAPLNSRGLESHSEAECFHGLPCFHSRLPPPTFS